MKGWNENVVCRNVRLYYFPFAFFFFLHDNLKNGYSFSTILVIYGISFCMFAHFFEDVHPYGYIIIGTGSHIPIYNFEIFCWSKKTKEILSH